MGSDSSGSTVTATPTRRLPPADPRRPARAARRSGGAARQSGHDDQRRGAVHERPRRELSVIAPSWADSLRVANDGGFRAAKTSRSTKTIPGARRVRPGAPAKDGLPALRQRRQTFTDDIILDQTKPTVSSATVAIRCRDRQRGRRTATAASKRRTYRVRVRAKDATSGVAKVQFACAASGTRARFASSSGSAATREPARRSTCACGIARATTAAGARFASDPQGTRRPRRSAGGLLPRRNTRASEHPWLRPDHGGPRPRPGQGTQPCLKAPQLVPHPQTCTREASNTSCSWSSTPQATSRPPGA